MSAPGRSRRHADGWRVALTMALTLGLVVGCTDDEPSADDPDTASSADAEDGVDVRLVVADNNVRAEGDECAGARPYNHVHAGAPFTVTDEDGEVLTEGTLPPGEAFNADPSIDWEVERIPTICVLEFTIGALPERERYEFQLSQGSGLPFDADDLEGDDPVLLVLG